MITLNEHVHLNMIDVYRKNRNSIQVMSQSFGHHPETSIRRKIPNRDAFLSKFLNEIFSPTKRFEKPYSPAGLFKSAIPRRCGLHTKAWSNSASEDYASFSFPFKGHQNQS